MDIILYFFAIIFVLLLILLVYTLVNDFKQIVIGFINMCEPRLFYPITWVLSPIWLVAYALDYLFVWNIIEKKTNYKAFSNDGIEIYHSTDNLALDFSMGKKIIISETLVRETESIIKEFLKFCDGHLKLEYFKIKNTNPVIILCPNQINFYDFSILTQHFCNEVKNSWGIFSSERLKYYSYSDEQTVHNIVGATDYGQKFSIYTLDDLYNQQYLKLNQELYVKKFDWNLINNRILKNL